MVRLVTAFLLCTQMEAACVAYKAELQAAETILRDGNPEAADDLLTPLQKDSAECPAILLLLGRAKHAEGMPSLARDLLTRYTVTKPKDPGGFVALSKVLSAQRDYQASAEAVQAALALNAQFIPALLLQAQLAERQGQFDDAESGLKSAAAVVPADKDAIFQLGAFLDRRHRAAEAVSVFRNYVKVDSANPFAWDYLALNQETSGYPLEAEDAYKAGLGANATASAHDLFLDYNYGRYLMKQNRLPESLMHLNRAVQLAPQTRAVYYERAKLHLLKQDIAAAQTDVDKALSLRDPGQYIQDVQLYALASSIASRRGDAGQALKYAELARASRLQSKPGGRQ